MSILWIPGSCPRFEISDEVLNQRAEHIKPIIKEGSAFYLLDPRHLRNMSFTWDPKYGDPVSSTMYEIARIETSHTCGYIGMFKPSVAEVLAQIPEHLLSCTKWFQTLTGDTVACYREGDGHRTTTILYSDKPLGS